MVGVAEVGQEFFRLFAGAFGGDLLAELVALGEFFANDADNVFGMEVGFGEDQGFGDFGSPGEDFGEAFFEGADDESDLVFSDDIAVKLIGGVGEVVVEFLVFFGFGTAVAVRDEGAGFFDEPGAIPGDFGFDTEDVEADIDAISDGAFVGVVLHEVLVEEAEGLLGGGGGEADERGIKVFKHLPPDVVDAAVAFIDDDEVKE